MTPIGKTVYFSHNKIFKPIKLMKSRQIDWIPNTKNIKKPTRIQNWFSKYFIYFSEITWKNVFTLIVHHIEYKAHRISVYNSTSGFC